MPEELDTPGTDPRLYVKPQFYQLTFDDKKNVASLCYAYIFELPQDSRAGGFMWIYDAVTNKKVGSLSGFSGFQMD